MHIQEAILHRIIKQPRTTGSDAAQVQHRETRLSADARLERTAEEILTIYNKSTSGYGTFDPNEEVYRFPALLGEYATAGGDFVAFTKSATDIIAYNMQNSNFATGGYALFLRYTNQAQDWVLVAMLKLKPGTGIDEETLELSDTLSFDTNHLHEAARVDLGKWQTSTQPYLSFIKKRQGGEDVTQYFRNALGCTEYTDAKYHTQQMQKAFDAFSENRGWTSEQKHDARQRVYDHCETKDRAGEPVNLQALSAIIDDQEPEAFSGYVRENSYEVAETFKPHRASYSRLKRISRTFGSIKVGFDVQDILDGRVDVDDDSGKLVIDGLPRELIDEIKRHKANDDTPAD